MLRQRATKIIATLGPASSSYDVIESLFKAGTDLFRLNFSHGTYEGHQQNVSWIREISRKADRPIGIMQDLQGPKLRVGSFDKGEVFLKVGQSFQFDLDLHPGTEHRVRLPHPEIFKASRPGHRLLLNDGRLSLIIQEAAQDRLRCRVDVGGPLSDKKGVTVPDCQLPLDALTQKDRQDLEFGLSLSVDWVALSFVQKAEDVLLAREVIGDKARLISKIEKPSALEQLKEITAASDAILIARGDLGVELPPEEVPPAQKEIIAYARSQAKPVAVATQMLESMVSSPTPTRAETSDVANAVYEGVDAVMLSAESATGAYPVESVSMMDQIIKRVERDPLYRTYREQERTKSNKVKKTDHAIMEAARQVCESTNARGMVTLTYSGLSSFQAAYERPKCLILALTPIEKVANQLSLVWGVYPRQTPEITSLLEIVRSTEKAVIEEKLAEVGEDIVITAGGSFLNSLPQRIFQAGSTRVLRIITLGER